MPKYLHILLFACMVFFTMNASAQTPPQTPEKSDHPLLDKYYPDLNRKPEPVAKPTPVPITSTPPPTVNATKNIVTPPPFAAPKIPMEIVESKPATVKDTSGITPTLRATTSLPATATISEANVPVANVPPQQKVQPPLISRPEGEIYRPTRLGSSSPQYDTYDKNKKGAGSVTTSPKG